MINLSVVIPTKDREEDLLKCVGSIAKQALRPFEVLIIDDGHISDATKEKIKQGFSRSTIPVKYFKKKNPSSAESKNLGAKEASGQVVLFLDDDVVLRDDYTKNLIEAWERRWAEKKLAGISGVITNSRKKSFSEKIFNIIFCLYSKKSWSVLPWGFQTWDYHLKQEELADWAPCGTTSFRKEIFDSYQFRPIQPGRVPLEDIEFSWQLNKDGYYFVISPLSELIHKESAGGRDGGFISGFKEGVSRKIIFRIHAEKGFKNRLYFCVSSFGWILRQFFAGHYSRGLGIIGGYFKGDKDYF